MECAKTRKDARQIESALLNKIAVKGVSSIAEAVGVAPSQVTRWKESLVPRMAMLLAVLEWGVVDDDLARLAKQVAALLTPNKKPRMAVQGSEQQITINF
ncbi:CII family transcriptional regulator [Serratia fonticola]